MYYVTALITDKKTHSLTKVSASTWRKIFLVYTNSLFINQSKTIFDRESTIPKLFIGHRIRIYAGNKYHSRTLNRWMVGHKYGEFSWTRKLALYKAKQLKKKKNSTARWILNKYYEYIELKEFLQRQAAHFRYHFSVPLYRYRRF